MYHTYIAFNALCLSVALLLTFAVVRMLRGTAAAMVAQGVMFLLVGCSPWMAVPYTDVPAMPPVTAAVACAVAAVGSRRRPWPRAAVLVGLASALVAVAFVVKSTPASTAVALVLLGLLTMLGGHRRLRVGAVPVCGVAVFAVTTTLSLMLAAEAAHVSRDQLDTSRTPPPTWWLANGLTTTRNESGRLYYGAYSPQMVKQSIGLSGPQLRAWSDRRLGDQLTSMGPAGVAAFELDKLSFNWATACSSPGGPSTSNHSDCLCTTGRHEQCSPGNTPLESTSSYGRRSPTGCGLPCSCGREQDS